MTAAAREAVRLWAPSAWIGGRWQDDVLLETDAGGAWRAVTPGQPAPADAERLAGPALPGLVDAHSHAFQRAFAGLAERRDAAAPNADDDFWSWRERMYAVANALTPPMLQAIAAHLFVELLRGGYTQVCEFHYLHLAGPADEAGALAFPLALADAAQQAGIGMTLLPALYERAGFGAPALRAEQRRFRADADAVWRCAQQFAARAPVGRDVPLNAGLAIHSLRAATPASIARLCALAEGFAGPIHIHAAEQTAEVDECRAALGAPPLAWLARQGLLDARWQLVHATHAQAAEIEAVAATGAGIVLCPGTEANLGDGLADLPGWLAAAVPLAIGSDSQVTRGWREELRWLEYGQRLARRRRNIAAAAPQAPPAQTATAARLFDAVRDGGGRACGEAAWGLAAGARADLLVVDPADASLVGIPAHRWLDALVFSSPGRPWRDVMVAGRWAVRNHRHPRSEAIGAAFAQAMGALWSPPA